jgi:hypothetical protein
VTDHLVATTSQGRVVHAVRNAWGAWSGVGDVNGQAGELPFVTAVASTAIWGELHVVAISSSSPGVWHTIRRADGSWIGFSDISAGLPVGQRLEIAAGHANDGLAVTVDVGGQIYTNTRAPDGSYTGWMWLGGESGYGADFRDLDGAGMGWARLLSASASGSVTLQSWWYNWLIWGVDVESVAGEVGYLTGSSVTPVYSDLHVIARDDNSSSLWHTVQRGDGTWQPFEDLDAFLGRLGPGSSRNLASTEMNGEYHIVSTAYPDRLFFAVRWTDGSWTGWEDLDPWFGPRPWQWRDVSLAGVQTPIQ